MPRAPVLSASILAADFAHLGEAVRQAELAGADWIHLDVMDGQFVPNLTLGPVIVEACRRSTSLPLDVHLMVHEPAPLFPALIEAGADRLTIHVEAVTHLHRQLETIRELGAHAGAALNPATSLVAVQEALPYLNLVLAMTVDPGFSGQRFIHGSLDKIRRLRRLLDGAGSDAYLQVDGGIDAETAPLAAAEGADCFVAAQAIFGHPEGIAAGVRALRSAVQPALAP